MKKILTLIISLLIVMLGVSNVTAEEKHLIVNNYEELLTDVQYAELDAGISLLEDTNKLSLYFVYDKDIKDDKIVEYTQDFIDVHSNNDNSVVITLNADYYVIKANGPKSNAILESKQLIMSEFEHAETFYDGVKACCTYVANLIGSPNVIKDVPRVDGCPRVIDFAELFTKDEINSITNRLNEIGNKYGMDIVFVTIKDACGLNSMNYADDFYDYNGYNNDGMLLLYDFDNRQVYISTKGKGLEYLTDYGREKVFDYMWDYFLDGEYYKATNKCFDRIDEYFDYARQGYPIDVNTKLPTKFGVGNILIAVGIAAVVTLIVSGTLKGQLKSVATQYFARNYVQDNSFVVTGRADYFVGSHVSKVKIDHDSGGRSGGYSGGGGSSSHTSSSGSTHGGGGRSFLIY